LGLNKSRLKEVTSVDLFEKHSKLKYVKQDGLLSEKIFGSSRSYKCSTACQELVSKTDEGKVCPKCGVRSTNNNIRYKYFGKVTLPFHVIKHTEKRNFQQLIKKEFGHILDPKKNDLSSSLKCFLKYDNFDTNKLEITKDYNPRDCIPLNITGIYSLYIALKVASEHLFNSKAKQYIGYFYDELLVVPPNCRLSVIGNDGGSPKIIISELDSIYSKILYLRKAMIDQIVSEINQYSNLYNATDEEITILATEIFKKKTEEFYDMVVKTTEAKMIDYVDDSEIQSFDEATSRLQYWSDTLYSHIGNQLSGKEGLIRKDFLGRYVDFSARAVIIPDPTLDTYQIKISKKVFIKLWLIEYSRWLWKVKGAAFETIKLFVKSTDIHDEYLEHIDEFITYFFENASQKEKLVFLNRQPTLWRYGNSAVEVIGTTEENVINVSPMIVEPYAADYDGDALAIYRLHSQKAIEDMNNSSFLLNTVKYDHNDKPLHTLMNEGKYCFSILIESKIADQFNTTHIDDLDSLKIDYNKHLTDSITTKCNNLALSYGASLVNKFARFKTGVIVDGDKLDVVSEKILLDSKNNTEYHERLNNLNSCLNWFLTIYQKETLTLPFVEAAEQMQGNNSSLINKLPKNPWIGNIIFNALIDKEYNKVPKDYKLWKLQKGKFNKKQFARSIVGIGYISDDNNIIQNSPITGTLFGGLSEDQFFETCFGSRKGIVDKQSVVPKSGYLERSMVMNLSPMEIAEEDCGVRYGFNIIIQDKRHATSMLNRYYFDSNTNKEHIFTELEVNDPNNIGKTFNFRSPISCITPNMRICQKCFGNYKNIKSPYVGILAGQYIAERLTQMSMSSFHTSGSCTLPVDKKLKEFIQSHLENITKDNISDTSTLHFDKDFTEEIMTILSELPGYRNLTARKVEFHNLEDVENEDVGKVITEVNELLNTENENDVVLPDTTYSKLIKYILDVGFVYSCFIEVVLANSYVNKEKVILRYAFADPNGNKKIHKKYSIKKIHTLLENGILSFLYEPNSESLTKAYDKFDTIDSEKATIFERIWMGKI
jgi:hypothetical protein